MKNIFNEEIIQRNYTLIQSYKHTLYKGIDNIYEALYYINLIKKGCNIHLYFYNDKFLIETMSFYSKESINLTTYDYIVNFGINNKREYLQFAFEKNKVLNRLGVMLDFNTVIIEINKFIKYED